MSGLKPWLYRVVDDAALDALNETSWRGLFQLVRADIAKAAIVLISTAALLTWRLLGTSRRARLTGLLLVAIQVVDLFLFSFYFLNTGSPALFEMPKGVVDFLREEDGAGVRVVPPAERPWSNFPAMYGAGNPGGYDIFLDRRYARYLNRSQRRDPDAFLSVERMRLGSPLVRHLGPRFLLTTEPLRNGRNRYVRGYDWMAPVGRYGDILVYENQDPPKRVALAHRVTVLDDELAAYRHMERESFDIADEVLVEAPLTDAFQPPEPLPAGASERAVITGLRPNRVEISVSAKSAAVLVMSDTLHPGWRAEVDGRRVPMVHANRVMRALPVPRGEHEVVMTYCPLSFTLGASLSFLSILALLAFLVIRRLRAQNRSP
jgi:hypothetical protein